MNISENLQRILTDKQNIANAINAKGVSCQFSESLDTYADKISRISGGENLYRYRNGASEFFDSWSCNSESNINLTEAGTFNGTLEGLTTTIGSAWIEVIFKPYCIPIAYVLNASYTFQNNFKQSVIGFEDRWNDKIATGLPASVANSGQYFGVGRYPAAYNSTINSFWSYSDSKKLKLRLNFRTGGQTSVTINNFGIYTLGYIA